MRGLISKIQDLSRTFSIEKVRDLLFPKFCAGCEKEGDWLCADCLPAAVISQESVVASNLDGIITLFDYGENTVSKLIRVFKYNYVLDVAVIFEKIINKTNFDNTWPGFAIIPVPLHARRERERGFNQAEVLANLFSKKLGLDVNKDLSRPVYTVQQAKLSGEERRKNLKDAFVYNRTDGVVPEKVLLVDDVFTTGTTMQECAGVLKNKGVKVVWGLVLAKG